MGPAKVVSRQHASISYNLTSRVWELHVLGRNGAKVDGEKVECGSKAPSTPLYSGCIVDIGGTQMMFILPDAAPTISQKVLDAIGSTLPRPKSKRVNASVSLSSNPHQNPSQIPPQVGQEQAFGNGYYYPAPSQNNLKAFQMFDNASEHLKNTSQNNPANAATNQANTQNDLAKDDAKDIKPPYSYATMITQAILSNQEGVLSLSQIYEWISKQYAFYRFSKSGWQNSIRHNLSLNKAFEKVPRRANEPGKGMKWQIAESYKNDFLKKVQNGSLAKVRRGSSVSRQLQLHLAQHNDLPSSVSNQKKVDQQHQLQQMQKFQQEFQLHSNEAAPQFIPGGPINQHAVYGQAYPHAPPMYGSNSAYAPQLPPLKQAPGQPIQPGQPGQLGQQPPPQPPQPSQQQQQQQQQAYVQQLPQQIPQQLPLPPQNQQQAGLFSHSRDSSLTSVPQFLPQPQQLPPAAPFQPKHSALQSDDRRPITQDSNSTDRTELKPLSSSSNVKGESQRQQTDEYEEPRAETESPKKAESISTPPKSAFPPLYHQGAFNNNSINDENTNTNNNNNTEETASTTLDQTTKQDSNSNLEFGMITSPTKSFSVSAVEAYTPERGTRKKDDKNSSNNNNNNNYHNSKHRQNNGPGGGNNLQSSPALWNFVQFSTPLGPNQGLKDDESKVSSPTKNGGGAFLPESPLNMKNGKKQHGGVGDGKERHDLGDLKNVDLAKGFQK